MTVWNPKKPDFVIRHHGRVYLNRWYIIPRNPWFNIYLHKFEHDDDDRALHDHPWHSVSLPLVAGYWDVLRGGMMVRVKPWRLVYRKPKQAHRVMLRRDNRGVPIHAWTLFFTGPRVREWGFHCPNGWRHWKDFTDPSDKGSIGPGCN